MDEVKLAIAQDRGIRAQALLDNALLQESFAYLESEYLKAWRNTKVKEADHREKFWQAIQILGIIQEHLKKFVTDGKVAAMDLARLAEENQRKNARSRN